VAKYFQFPFLPSFLPFTSVPKQVKKIFFFLESTKQVPSSKAKIENKPTHFLLYTQLFIVSKV